MVRQMIAAEGISAFDGPVNFLIRHRQQPAVKVSRTFLGVRLDCARCHDHPFDRWTREDFDRFNAFFRSVQYEMVSPRNIRVSEVPRQAEPAERPRFLTGASPRTSRWRDELALLVTTCRPFARNFANRIWYQLMGRGIVDPPDDFVDGAAVAPQLLEFLSDLAKQSKFDVRVIVRAVCNSQAYQREAAFSRDNDGHQRLFTGYQAKPMTPQQLVDSLKIALELDWNDAERERQLGRLVTPSVETEDHQTWDYRDNIQDVMGSLVQDYRIRDTSITAIYEKILSRRPTDRELALCGDRDRSQIVFALVHSNEFRFAH